MLLDGAGGAVLVECALGHAGEDFNQWIRAYLLVLAGHLNDARSKVEEGPAEEQVDEEDVAHDVDQVEDFTENVH